MVGKIRALFDVADVLLSFGQSHGDDLSFHPGALPDVVVFPRTTEEVRRVVSVCTGAFLLAEAGLLDGRRSTTHWLRVEEFARRYPQTSVEPDSIFVNDGKFYTSAGITSGMDLALHLVEADYGAGVALTIARNWLLYVKRPGGQSQFSALLPEKASQRSARSVRALRVRRSPGRRGRRR